MRTGSPLVSSRIISWACVSRPEGCSCYRVARQDTINEGPVPIEQETTEKDRFRGMAHLQFRQHHNGGFGTIGTDESEIRKGDDGVRVSSVAHNAVTVEVPVGQVA